MPDDEQINFSALADRARADALQLFTPSVVGEEDQGLV